MTKKKFSEILVDVKNYFLPKSAAKVGTFARYTTGKIITYTDVQVTDGLCLSGFNGTATLSVTTDIITAPAKDFAKTLVMSYHWPTIHTVIGPVRKSTTVADATS